MTHKPDTEHGTGGDLDGLNRPGLRGKLSKLPLTAIIIIVALSIAFIGAGIGFALSQLAH